MCCIRCKVKFATQGATQNGFATQTATQKMKFTDRQIRNLKSKATRYEVWEGNGLGVRISPKGTKTWVAVYHHEGKARRMTLGRYPGVSVAEAHRLHSEAMVSLSHGNDPGKALVDKNKAERKAGTVAELVDDFIERHAKQYRAATWQENQRMLYKDVVPEIGRKKAKNVTRKEIIALLDKVVARGAPVQANRLKSLLATMFNFAVDKDILTASPCVGLKPPASEAERERTLSESEIKLFWRNIDKTSMELPAQLLLKFQLVTGQRSGEIAAAEWSEIDYQDRVWILPKDKTKNRQTHIVPLSAMALELLDDIKALSEESRWLFPARRGNGHRTRPAISRAVIRNREVFGIEPFTPHDLRRSVRTQLGKLRVPPHIAEKVINHTVSKMEKTYDRYDYLDEKREALERWSERLQRIIDDGETQ